MTRVGLVDYLEANLLQATDDHLHRALIDNVVSQFTDELEQLTVYREVGMFRDGRLEGCIDLVVLGPDVWLVEGKVLRRPGGTKKGNYRANRQLRTGYEFFKEMFQISPRLLYAYRSSGSRRINFQELERPVEDLVLLG